MLDDHFTVYCTLSNGAKALVRASQICIGFRNDLGIVVAGTQGTLSWRQEDPECLRINLPGQPDRSYWRGAVAPGRRIPAEGHAGRPSVRTDDSGGAHGGIPRCFARLHRCFEEDVRRWKAGLHYAGDGSTLRNVEDGRTGIAFIDACVRSSQARAPGRRCRRLPVCRELEEIRSAPEGTRFEFSQRAMHETQRSQRKD